MISVIIPAYNEEKTIKQCLGALQNQILQPDEIIVVDNNSHDKTIEVVTRFFPNVRIIQELKKGTAHARDAGFAAAHGDIVCRTDADSTPSTTWTQHIMNEFNKNRRLVAVSGPITYKEVPLSLLGTIPSIMMALVARVFFGHHILYGPNLAVKKSALGKIKPCSENQNIHEDFDLAHHLAKIGAVHFSFNIIMRTSGRRIYRTPKKFFIDYSRMFFNHFKH